MAAVMVPQAAQQRSEHRDATKVIRANAGLDASASTNAVAEIGAAARRLRASNRWNESAPLRTNLPVPPVAPVRVVRVDHSAPDADRNAVVRNHPAGGNLPRRLRLV